MADFNKFPTCVLLFVFFTFFVSLVCSSASPRTDGKLPRGSDAGLFRSKRQVCVDGTYEYNGRTCCNCAAGQKLEKDCVSQQGDRDCQLCEKGTYNSEANNKRSCEPCRSCDQPNANLEEEEACTTASNTKCRCKKDHYCDKPETCIICNPCKVCGAEGIKIPCTAQNNTVCNHEYNEGLSPGAIFGIVFGVLLAVAVVILLIVYFLKRKTTHWEPVPKPEILPLKDLRSHLPEVADVVGWRVMEHLAISSNIKHTIIESCKLDHPGDSQAQTQQLLKIWMEREGRDASKKLIQMLRQRGTRRIAQDVEDILKCENAATPNNAV